MDLKIQRTTTPKKIYEDENNIGFGKIFTDHMFIMDYNPDKKWHDHRIVKYDKFSMAACTSVLHYGQTIFEGLKGYYTKEGNIQLFRPLDNFKRMNKSAARMCMPEINIQDALKALQALLNIDKNWLPKGDGTSLYIRPFMFATDEYLGVKASDTYRFCIIMSPSGLYYKEGLNPTKIFVEKSLVRAVAGGTGDAKTAGNYASSILASQIAKKAGYTQVLWLDGVNHKYVEEVGSMNIFFVIDNILVTPALNGSILPGITRDSIIQLAKSMNIPVEERKISIDEICKAQIDGTLQECFGTGTAAIISPVGMLAYNNKEYIINNNQIGNMTHDFYEKLTSIQYGNIKDDFNWTMTID